jgi:hypothetical protein
VCFVLMVWVTHCHFWRLFRCEADVELRCNWVYFFYLRESIYGGCIGELHPPFGFYTDDPLSRSPHQISLVSCTRTTGQGSPFSEIGRNHLGGTVVYVSCDSHHPERKLISHLIYLLIGTLVCQDYQVNNLSSPSHLQLLGGVEFSLINLVPLAAPLLTL